MVVVVVVVVIGCWLLVAGCCCCCCLCWWRLLLLVSASCIARLTGFRGREPNAMTHDFQKPQWLAPSVWKVLCRVAAVSMPIWSASMGPCQQGPLLIRSCKRWRYLASEGLLPNRAVLLTLLNPCRYSHPCCLTTPSLSHQLWSGLPSSRRHETFGQAKGLCPRVTIVVIH